MQLIHTRREVVALATALVAGGGIAAAAGIALNRLPVGLTANVLVRLRVVGYPTDRLVRYIEDDPTLARRATGTAVDPNSFAGFLMVVLVLAVGQAVAKRPLVPRPLAICAAPLAAVCPADDAITGGSARRGSWRADPRPRPLSLARAGVSRGGRPG